MKTTELTCSECGKAFVKPNKEITRRKKAGKSQFYCTQSCAVKVVNRQTGSPWLKGGKTDKNGRRADVLSPFRWFILRGKARKDKGFCDLTPEYLKEVYESQQGLCPISGQALVVPITTNGFLDGLNPYNASMDRLDNSRGYVIGNIRFVAVMANYARNIFTDQQLIEFCCAVAARHG